jgi:hypothetical protein
MIDLLFILYLVLAFAVGSFWVTAITLAAEKWGSIVGGILGGLPSTSAFSFMFIGLNQSTNVAVEATTVFPLAFSVTCSYLFFYAYFAQKSFKQGIVISLAIWFTISLFIVGAGLSDFVVALIGGIGVSVLTYIGFVKKLQLRNLKGEQKLFKLREILFRGVGAGFLVSISVMISQIGGPILGGISAAFPALFTSTIIILYHSKGVEFSRAITKPLVFSGILTIIPYSVAVKYLYPILGVWVGTGICYLIVLPLAALSYFLVKRG